MSTARQQTLSIRRSAAHGVSATLLCLDCPASISYCVIPLSDLSISVRTRTMARTSPDDSTRNGSRSRTSGRVRRRTDCMSLPFNSHPLYQWRRATIIFAVIGALLCFLGSSYWGPYWLASLHSSFLLLALSAFLCALDLICYASRKKDNPDEEPDRPTGKWALIDLIMAILLQFVFWASVAEFGDSYAYPYYNVLGLYGILADLVCS